MAMDTSYVAETRAILEDIARNRKPPMPYSEIAKRIGVAAQSMGGVLCPISQECVEHGRALITVLAVQKRSKIPSPQFFDQARKLGAMAPNLLPAQFFETELARVYAEYDELRSD